MQKLCQQLKNPVLEEELARQVVKNLVFLARTYQPLDTNTLPWLTRKMVKVANYETINHPQISVKVGSVN
jgi:hypothetical protein